MTLSQQISNELSEMEKVVHQLSVSRIALSATNRRLISQHEEEAAIRSEINTKRSVTEIPANPILEHTDNYEGTEHFHPLSLCPDEVWKLTFDHIDDAVDLVNFQRTCKLFSIILRPRVTTFQFHKVIAFIQCFVGKLDMLSCRLVCRAWRSAIDSRVEDAIFHKLVHASPSSSRMRFLPNLVVCFENTFDDYTRPGQFLLQMDYHTGMDNPFVGRALRMIFHPLSPLQIVLNDRLDLQPRMEERERIFWEAVYNVFQRFGAQLHYFRLSVARFYPQSNMTQIRRFLNHDLHTLVPNLKYLRLEGFVPCLPRGYVWRTEGFPALRGLDIQLDSNVIRLQRTNILGHYRNPDLQLTPSHLRKLQVSWPAWIRWGLCQCNWSNLIQLDIVDYENQTVSASKNYLLINARLAKLEHLGIKPSYRWAIGYNPRMILEVVKGLSLNSKLNTLQISEGLNVYSPNTVTDLAPASLTKIEIEHSRDSIYYSSNTYNFLINFPFLQHLNLYWLRGHPDAVHQFLRENDDFEINSPTDLLDLHKSVSGRLHVYEACAWDILSRLQVIVVDDIVFTRAGYDDFKRQNKSK